MTFYMDNLGNLATGTGQMVDCFSFHLSMSTLAAVTGLPNLRFVLSVARPRPGSFISPYCNQVAAEGITEAEEVCPLPPQ